MQRIWKRIKEESAGAMVENVIILPLVFIVIFSLILTSFIVHDRATIESAAKRGAIYASYCVSDPNYAAIAGQDGELDFPYDTSNEAFSFSGVGSNIKAYRYLVGGNNVEAQVKKEVQAIVEKTRIPWKPIETVRVDCKQVNRLLYQDITVTVTADYSIPAFFAAFGLETDYEYTATAKIASTDPDEFIRNADLVVDLMTSVDKQLGSPIQKAIDSISTIGVKIIEWIGLEK